jgi:hypothetical protein
MNHHAPNRFGNKERTIRSITLDLDLWLMNSRIASFDATTLPELQRRYSKLEPRVVEAKFNAAMMRRRDEPR